MEKAKNIFLTIVILFMVGCATPTVSHRDMVLIDSEIPWKMSPGEYIAIDGTVYAVSGDAPRWSVSEAWMFNSFIEQSKSNKTAIYFLVAGTFVLLVIIQFAIRRYK
jgi:hypothetical protein